ncbi:MAG: class I SAM-dependent methyltransferase [Verrucomicrobia bacterium]|nr:class I SAM-dependent methyltransferase [Verrucomicrobiota bacterium]
MELTKDVWTPGSLEKIHRGKISGKVSDKWELYLKVYDRLLAPLEHQKVSLLEIGVQNGGSLESWSQYFKQAEIIVGCDINPLCSKLTYQDPKIHVVVGDANSAEALEKIRRLSPGFDVIIDDGSHFSNDIVNSFNLYFPLVKPGGIYIMEDTHTLYHAIYGGGLKKKNTATAFFKLFADLVNREHWQEDVKIEKLMGGFGTTALTDEVVQGWVESVEFRNSLIIVRKEPVPTHAKLGTRLVVGTEALVETAILNKTTLEKMPIKKSWKDPKSWF